MDEQQINKKISSFLQRKADEFPEIGLQSHIESLSVSMQQDRRRAL